MCVCRKEERKCCGGKGDKQETSHLSNVGGHFLLFLPFPVQLLNPVFLQPCLLPLQQRNAQQSLLAMAEITWQDPQEKRLASPFGIRAQKPIQVCFFFPLEVPPLYPAAFFPPHRLSLSFWCALLPSTNFWWLLIQLRIPYKRRRKVKYLLSNTRTKIKL